MGVDGEEADACWVNAGNDEVCPYVALVAEEVLFQHGHAGCDSRCSAGGEGVEFDVGTD